MLLVAPCCISASAPAAASGSRCYRPSPGHGLECLRGLTSAPPQAVDSHRRRLCCTPASWAQATDRLITQLEAAGGSAVNINERLAAFSLDVIGNTAFGWVRVSVGWWAWWAGGGGRVPLASLEGREVPATRLTLRFLHGCDPPASLCTACPRPAAPDLFPRWLALSVSQLSFSTSTPACSPLSLLRIGWTSTSSAAARSRTLSATPRPSSSPLTGPACWSPH